MKKTRNRYMSVLNRAFESARKKNYKVVFPENNDQRMIDAAKFLEKENLAKIIWLDNLKPTKAHENVILKTRPKTPRRIVQRLLQKPLFFAAAMVQKGDVDTMIAGIENPTRRVIEAASMSLSEGISEKQYSSFFLMLCPDGRELIFSDCAVNVIIDAQTLTSIALNAATIAKKLFGKAEIAMLSFSTGTSGEGETVSMVREATENVFKEGFDVFGPIQADAALSKSISEKKGLDKGGNANVLIFPSLDAGNISYKLCQELAGVQSIGPFLQGFSKPICDLSRGASTEDIIAATVISLMMI
tara:strand:- start:1547 stop:2449 length:903 start_codon:yes stop_codon:yes gene_type:complete